MRKIVLNSVTAFIFTASLGLGVVGTASADVHDVYYDNTSCSYSEGTVIVSAYIDRYKQTAYYNTPSYWLVRPETSDTVMLNKVVSLVSYMTGKVHITSIEYGDFLGHSFSRWYPNDPRNTIYDLQGSGKYIYDAWFGTSKFNTTQLPNASGWYFGDYSFDTPWSYSGYNNITYAGTHTYQRVNALPFIRVYFKSPAGAPKYCELDLHGS